MRMWQPVRRPSSNTHEYLPASNYWLHFICALCCKVLTVGTLVTHVEKDKEVIRSVVASKKADEIMCTIIELASRKKKQVYINLFHFLWYSFPYHALCFTLSVCSTICLSVCLSVRPSVYLSICFSLSFSSV